MGLRESNSKGFVGYRKTEEFKFKDNIPSISFGYTEKVVSNPMVIKRTSHAIEIGFLSSCFDEKLPRGFRPFRKVTKLDYNCHCVQEILRL